jgi:hypothetical protein
MYFGFYPAILTAYDAATRIGTVMIDGLTDGADQGLDATFAYPIGESDLDTELKVDCVALPAPVYVFFEAGDPSAPVISSWRGHQDGSALAGIRRIRQKNIELLADQNITLNTQQVDITCKNMTITVNEGLTINTATAQVVATTALQIQAPVIQSQGAWAHTGVFSVSGLLSANGGLAAIGGSMGIAAAINGLVLVNGEVTVNGIGSSTHIHPIPSVGNTLTPIP